MRLLHSVHGDPRAAAELVTLLTERQAAGLDPLPTEPADLAPALLRALRAEIRALPDDTRLLLLLAAADQYPVATHAFLRATAAARLDTRPLERAETVGVAHSGEQAVSSSATPGHGSPPTRPAPRPTAVTSTGCWPACCTATTRPSAVLAPRRGRPRPQRTACGGAPGLRGHGPPHRPTRPGAGPVGACRRALSGFPGARPSGDTCRHRRLAGR